MSTRARERTLWCVLVAVLCVLFWDRVAQERRRADVAEQRLEARESLFWVCPQCEWSGYWHPPAWLDDQTKGDAP